MTLPMVGSWSVRVHAVTPFTIHSDLYYELHVSRLDEQPDQVLSIRVPQHAVKAQPAEGENMTITFLMGQVTGATPL